jgi:hypothetical protein
MEIRLKVELFKIFLLDFSMTSGKSKREEITNEKKDILPSTNDTSSKPKS